MEAVCAEWCWLDDGQALPRAIIVSELAAEGSTSGLELNSVCLRAFFVLFFFSVVTTVAIVWLGVVLKRAKKCS